MYTASTYTAINAPVTSAKSVGLLTLISAMIATRKQRAALATLDDAQLQDLGLSYAEAQAEAARPFWDLPAV